MMLLSLSVQAARHEQGGFTCLYLNFVYVTKQGLMACAGQSTDCLGLHLAHNKRYDLYETAQRGSLPMMQEC